MLDKLKKALSEHKYEILVIGGVAFYVGVIALVAYRMGEAHAWPPKELAIKLFEKDGKHFIVLNNELYMYTR